MRKKSKWIGELRIAQDNGNWIWKDFCLLDICVQWSMKQEKLRQWRDEKTSRLSSILDVFQLSQKFQNVSESKEISRKIKLASRLVSRFWFIFYKLFEKIRKLVTIEKYLKQIKILLIDTFHESNCLKLKHENPKINQNRKNCSEFLNDLPVLLNLRQRNLMKPSHRNKRFFFLEWNLWKFSFFCKNLAIF